MARRGWARSVTRAITTAGGAAAAQIGLGYGLGVVSWNGAAAAKTGVAVAAASDDGAWSAGLAWTVLICATSVVIGAVAADRAAGRGESGPILRGTWLLAIALAATVGGVVAVPLLMLPARGAHVPGNFAPHLLVGIYAAAGLVLGLVIAVLALTSRAIAANVIATAGWLWALGIVVLIDRSATGQPMSYAAPAVWKFTESGPIWSSYYLPGAMLMLGVSLLIGGLAAYPAAGRGEGRLGIAVSGGVGPALVAAAYALAAPDPASAPFEQVSAYHTAPYLVIAGLAGSLLFAAFGGAPGRPRRRPDSSSATPPSPTGDGAMPPGLALSAPAIAPAAPRRAIGTAAPRAAIGTAAVPAGSRATPGADQLAPAAQPIPR